MIMKRYKITHIFASLLLLATATSCEDYLTENNPNKIEVADYWKTLDDTRMGLNATYATMRKEAVLNTRYEAVRSDLAWPSSERPAGIAEAKNWYEQQYNNSTPAITAKWNALYSGVWRANQVIEALERLEGTVDADEWRQQMAEARFMRGLFYFYLHSSFNGGSVVLKQKTPENQDEYNQPLSTAEDVKTFFRRDLEYAVNNLHEKFTSATREIPVKATAQTILGTSFLYEGEFADARNMFKSVINDGPFRLETDMSKMFTATGEFNSESILEIPYSRELHPELGEWNENAMTNALATFAKSWFVPSSWLSVAYLEDTPDKGIAINNEVSENGVARTVSLRTSAMVAVLEDAITPYYMTGNASQQINTFGGPNAGRSFARWKKFQNWDIMEKEDASLSGKNIVVNRLSDVYLMYAECLLKADHDIDGALFYINAVRSRWAVTKLSGAKYDTEEEIMQHLMFVERPLELSAEGHQIRWQDLRRWGLLEDDENNIFYRRSKETFYAYKPSVLPLKLDGKKYANLNDVPNFSVVSSEWPLNPAGIQFPAISVVEINEEYDVAARNYSKRINQYYPIPASELRNNSKL